MLTFRKISSAEVVDRLGKEVVSDVSSALKKSVKDIKDAGKKVSDKYHLPNDKFSKSSTGSAAERLDARINKLERFKNHPNMPEAKKAEIDALLEEVTTIKKDIGSKSSTGSAAEQLDVKINKLERLKNHPNMPEAKKTEIDALLEELKTIRKDIDVTSETGASKTTAEHVPDIETAIKNESEFAQTDFLNKDAYGNDLNDPLNPLNKTNPLSPHYEDPMTRGAYNQDLYDPFESMNKMDPLSPYYDGGF